MNDIELKVKHKKSFNIKIPIIIGLIISLPINFLLNFYLGWDPSILDDSAVLTNGLILQWIIVLILILLIVFWEKKSLDSIGIKKITKTDIIWGFVVLIILVLLSFATEPLVKFLNLQSQSSEIVNVLMLTYILRISLVLTAGITEEIIFRGYLIERINFLTNHLLFSAIISYFAFIMFHIPSWGIGGAIQIAVWAIPITILYVRRRNLTTCIIIHLLYDGAILIPMLYGY